MTQVESEPNVPRPFLLRLLVPMLLAMVAIFAICGAVVHWAGQRSVAYQQRAELNRLAGAIRAWGLTTDQPLTDAQRQQLRLAAETLGARLILIGTSDRWVFDSYGRTDGYGQDDNVANFPEIAVSRQQGFGSTTDTLDSMGDRVTSMSTLIDPANPKGWVLDVVYPLRTWGPAGTPLWAVLGGAAASALIMLTLVAWLLQRRWIGPLRSLTRLADEMASGNWQARAEASGADDIRIFGSRLNRVAEKAEMQLSDLNHQRRDLQSLVDTLPDPIIVTDPQQRIILINKAASKLLELSPQQVLGKKFISVVSDEPILDFYDQAATACDKDAKPAGKGTGRHREVRVVREGTRHTYQAYSVRMTTGGILLVLRNVSTMSAAIQMKTDFVANASHELRTPIAAIKIAFETLREVYSEDPQQSDRCIQIIDGHLRRLEEMLRDLLDLSRVESSELKPHMASVKLTDLFGMIRSSVGSMARQKNLELAFEDKLPEDRASIVTDERLLNLVLKNLVENSIKFTGSGGRVTVAVEEGTAGMARLNATPGIMAGASNADKTALDMSELEHSVLVSVMDTGIGIGHEHIERVFERFYQADPSRTGSAGRGTGLGLAIVKHAIAGLGGVVHLKSKSGVGTVVACLLPQPIDAAGDPKLFDEAISAAKH